MRSPLAPCSSRGRRSSPSSCVLRVLAILSCSMTALLPMDSSPALDPENTGHLILPVINCRSWSMVLGVSTRTRPYRPASWAVMRGAASVRGPPPGLAGVCWPQSVPFLLASPRGGAVMRGGASIRAPPHRLAGVCWPRSASFLPVSPRGGAVMRGGASVRGPRRLAGVCWPRSALSLPASPRGGAVMRGGASIRGPHRLAGVCWPRSTPSLPASPRGGAVMKGGASIPWSPPPVGGGVLAPERAVPSRVPSGWGCHEGRGFDTWSPHRLAGMCWPRSAPLLSSSPRGGPATRPKFWVAPRRM